MYYVPKSKKRSVHMQKMSKLEEIIGSKIPSMLFWYFLQRMFFLKHIDPIGAKLKLVLTFL